MSRQELEEQLKVKRQQHYECVGWLYKSILEDEIANLNKQLRELKD